MAKSMRSKWKRKCRAVKRERYGVKELERLQRTLSKDPHNKLFGDAAMVDITSEASLVKRGTFAKASKRPPKSESVTVEDSEKMETSSKDRIFNPRTMKDQNGTYPVWMNQRKIHKQKKVVKAKKGKKHSRK